jgi:peptidoglycan/LPS O-acetylase OafA/YrhL
MSTNKINNRLNSLDILRSLAIILVIIFHYQVFVSHQDNFGIISEIGWIGVDLFFVLSGYLISNEIFIAIKEEKFSLKIFYIKRLFKTLPNYYMVLALYFMLPSFAEKPIIRPFWEYVFFIQNFNLPVSGFSQSWSLCVEEQFYLVFPFLAIWLGRKHKLLLPIILLLTMLLGVLGRSLLWQHLYATNNIHHFTTMIYYPTYCRLDGFISGICVAYIKNYYPIIWQRVITYGNTWLIVGLILLALFIPNITEFNGFLTAAIGYPFVSICFALIMVSALSNDSCLSKYNIPFMTKLAKWSYAIYLLQKPISVLCANYFSKIGLNNNSYVVILLNISIQILVGYIMFYCIESKFMLIRNNLLNRINTFNLKKKTI